MKKKLAILTSHPIQYNAPVFEMLAASEKLDIRVFYTWSQSMDAIVDKDFGKTIRWDIPLLEGYPYEVVENISTNPGPGSFKGIVCPSLIPKLKEWGARALLVFGWNYHAHYHAMKHFKGRIPVFFRGDSTLLDETGGIRSVIRRTVLKFVYRHADYAFYVGENNRRYFLKHGFAEGNMFFAPHAIDNKRFGDADGSMRRLALSMRDELGISPEETVVLFAGKFEPKKDPVLLVRAARALDKPGVHFVFTGNGALEQWMREEAGSDPKIHFLPFQNQSRMPAVYHLCDILALTSKGPGETWGLVVNEAMACGKAVLVSDKCGCAGDLVHTGVNGYVMQAGSIDSCILHLDKITASRDQAIRMGVESKKIIGAWSFEAVCSSFETHISSIGS